MYTVTINKTGESFDFKDPKEALDYGEKFNGRRMARIVDIHDGIREDLGEMKYEILSKTQTVDTGSRKCEVYRIKALRDFYAGNGKSIKAGDLGGWVGSYDNLDHQGHCWIFDDAAAFEKGFVREDAHLHKKAFVFENGEVFGEASVGDNVRIYGFGKVEGHATIKGIAHIYGMGRVTDRAYVKDAGISLRTIGGNTYIDCLGNPTGIIYIDGLCNELSLTAYTDPNTLKSHIHIGVNHFKNMDEFAVFVKRDTSPYRTQLEAVKEFLENRF